MKDSRSLAAQPSPQPPPDREGGLAARCPRCSAEPGAPCKDRKSKVLDKPHAGRLTVLKAAVAFRDRIDWCRENVPGEHPGLAAAAGMVLAAGGLPVSAVAIRARLKATGRDSATLGLESA